MKKVHVVDDDLALSELISNMIVLLGHKATRSYDVSSTNIKSLPDYDLLIIDLILGNQDAIELLRLMSNSPTATPPIVLMSGQHESVLNLTASLGREHNLNIVGTLQKPFGMSQLKRLVESALGVASTNKMARPNRLSQPTAGSDLTKHIANDEFLFHYQPQVDIKSREICGYEALARWNHPEYGVLGPLQFIPYAEENGYMEPLFKALLIKGITEIAPLIRDTNQTISINISTVQLVDLTLPDFIVTLIKDNGLKPAQIIIEITESRVFDQIKLAYDIIIRFVLKGMKLSIDDYGTGSSTLEQLSKLPVTELKIDKQFVTTANSQTKNSVIIESTVRMAKSMKLSVVAEGIETIDEYTMVTRIGVDIGQGYLFSKPMAFSELIELPHRL